LKIQSLILFGIAVMLTSSLLSSNDSSTIYEFITFAQNNNNSSSGSHGHMASDITGGGIQVSLDESSTCPSSSVSNNQSLISNTNSQNTAGMASGSDLNTSNLTFSINTDMQRPVVYLINPVTDNITTVNLCQNSQYPSGSMPLHTLITPNGDTAFVSTMSSPTAPATILVLKIGNIDWETGNANVSISDVVKIRDPNTKPIIIPKIGNHSTNHTQPVNEALWFPNNVQIHGPTLHPSEKFAYFTEWTNNTIRILNVDNGTLAAKDPIQFGNDTRWLHGVFFNPAGSKALSPHYFFEGNHVHLFDVNNETGDLTNPVEIRLGNNTHYAAFPHHVTWINNTHAVTSTQQLGPTNVTSDSSKIIGPSVWLINTEDIEYGEDGNDTVTNTEAATMIIPFTNSTQKEGIYKPASDTAIIGNKLYVAEEDSMDAQIDKEGQVSIWNISNILDPQLIKRMSPGPNSPGPDLPENFELGHTIYSTPDNKTVYVEDWHSGQLVKIDTSIDEVVEVFNKNTSGFKMPHGGFITGKYR
jgi:hypothetical protein